MPQLLTDYLQHHVIFRENEKKKWAPCLEKGGKNAHSISQSLKQNQGSENRLNGRSWENKAVMISIEIGCLASESPARDIFRECITGSLSRKNSAFSSYQIEPWNRDQEQCNQPLWPGKFRRIYGQQEEFDHLI